MGLDFLHSRHKIHMDVKPGKINIAIHMMHVIIIIIFIYNHTTILQAIFF